MKLTLSAMMANIKHAALQPLAGSLPTVTGRILPLLVGLGISTATICLWHNLNLEESAQIERKTELKAYSLKTELAKQISDRILGLVRMAKPWEKAGKPTQENWEVEAALYVEHFGGTQVVEWVDSSFYVRWIVPRAGDEPSFNGNLAVEKRRRQALEIAQNQHKVALAHSVDLVQGGKGLAIYVPIFLEKEGKGKRESSQLPSSHSQLFEGFILGVFRSQNLFDSILHENISKGYGIAIFQEDEQIYQRHHSSKPREKQWLKEEIINLYGVTWRIQVWPGRELLEQERSPLSQVVLGAGLAIAFLLALAVDLAQKNHHRSKLVESANRKLCREIGDRRLVQEELSRSQQHSQSLLNWIDAIVWEADPQTFQLTFISQQAERLSGYPVKTWLSEPDFWQNHLHPDDREQAVNFHTTSFKEQTEYEFEYRLITADERIIWLRDIVNVIAENNHPIKLRGVMLDITKTKQAEIDKLQLMASLQESEERYRAVVEQSAEGIFLIDGSTKKVIEANSSYLNLIGYNSKEVLQLTLYDIVNIDRENLDSKIEQVFSDNHLYINEMQQRRKDGSSIYVSASISLISYDSRKVFCIAIHDISARQQVEEALRESQRLTQRINEQLTIKVNELEQRNDEITLLSHMSDLIQTCLNREEAARVISQFMPLLFPQSSGSIFMISNSKSLVETITSWGDTVTTNGVFSTIECIALRRGHPHLVEDTHRGLVCNHIHAELLPSAYFCIPMVAQGEAMGMLYLSFPESAGMPALPKAKQHLAVTVARQISLALANIKLHETLQQQSIRDALTGLFNRRYLEESLERELHRARRTQQQLGICMIDADRFKRFNDTFGHEAGDAVLRELAIFLQKNIRGSDIACRYGGEELTLILPDASLEETRIRAEHLREGVKQLRIEHRRQPLGCITISIGVACFPEHGNSSEALVRAADTALYRAKKEGRDRVVTAS